MQESRNMFALFVEIASFAPLCNYCIGEGTGVVGELRQIGRSR